MKLNRLIFEKSVRFFSKNQIPRYILHFIYKVLPMVMFVAYPSLLLYAVFRRPDALYKLISVPLCVFLGVTALRVIVNEQRPYEKYGKPSVFHKTTKGKSFPSRHTASAFIIAMAFLYINVPLGILAMIFAFLIEISRILAGAHYVHDVAAGMAISIICGYVYIFLV